MPGIDDLYIATEHSSEEVSSPYENLAVAIIEQAVKDYIVILRKMWGKDLNLQKKRALFSAKTGIERFFHSPWYEALTDLDPEHIISGCKRVAIEQEKQSIQAQNRKRAKEIKENLKNSDSHETDFFDQGDQGASLINEGGHNE